MFSDNSSCGSSTIGVTFSQIGGVQVSTFQFLSDSLDSVSGDIIGASIIGASNSETVFTSAEIGSFCGWYSGSSDVSGAIISTSGVDSTASSFEISSVSISSVNSCGAMSCKTVEISAISFSLRWSIVPIYSAAARNTSSLISPILCWSFKVPTNVFTALPSRDNDSTFLFRLSTVSSHRPEYSSSFDLCLLVRCS